MIKKLLTPSNWKKAYYYLKKNGLKAAVLAAMERLEKSENDNYQYIAPSKEELNKQKELSKGCELLFSILVPVYKTPEKYFREMIQSVLNQSYPNWELLLGDASPDDRLLSVVEETNDSRVKYIKIAENKGISANTNVILEQAKGQYIGLLDHDDVLTPDALFCVHEAIKQSEKQTGGSIGQVETDLYAGKFAKMIYSDEDKGDGEMKHFYDVNHKPAFDQDYLWSNNYICHFTVLEAGLMKELGFRPEFDGAQDLDIFLRAARKIAEYSENTNNGSQVLNISKVLYHWRCHMDSTAVNPQSKLYAYEAGKRAVEEDLRERGIEARVSHSKHLGFYQVTFADIFRDRPEVAMVAGPVYRSGRIVGGARDAAGQLLYGGLLKGFSGGHLHRASVWQQCYAADFDNALFRQDLFLEFLKMQGMQGMEELQKMSAETKDRLCMAWAEYVHERAMIILYNPEME